MKAKIDAFLACMKEKGWNIELCETKGKYLPEGVVSRYKNVPVLWKEFIGTARKMVCSDETECFYVQMILTRKHIQHGSGMNGKC